MTCVQAGLFFVGIVIGPIGANMCPLLSVSMRVRLFYNILLDLIWQSYSNSVHRTSDRL
jgi:hypothetical protein